MLKNFGIASWIGCILILGYQAATWAITASWPSLTLMDLPGWSATDFMDALPVDVFLKALYVLFTTELAVALWWLGAGFFALSFAKKIIFGK